MIKIRTHIFLLFASVAMLMLLAVCSGSPGDKRLLALYADKIENQPEEALAALDSIDPGTLRAADRQFYDLLRIKAQDKAYVTHTSDSVILRLVNYYSHHKHDDLYPEVLYYAGRVYNDMGDYPTALKYYQQAIDALPENTSNIYLKSRILCQTGSILDHLRLYEDAVKYFTEELKLSFVSQDTLEIVQSYQILGSVYLRKGDLNEAEKCFQEALKLNSGSPGYISAKSRLYLASILYEKGNIKEAERLVRNLHDSVKPISRNFALTIASKIYNSVGMYDSVYTLSKKIVNSNDSNNRRVGFYYLLQPELKAYLPIDTLYKYVQDYTDLMESYYDENSREMTLLQQSAYNYDKHERDKEKALRENANLKLGLVGCIVILCIITIFFLITRLVRVNDSLRLWRRIDRVHQLQKDLDTPNPTESEITNAQLREKLMKDLEEFVAHTSPARPINFDDSEVYKELNYLIKEKKTIPEQSDIWNRLEHEILNASPDFKKKLVALTESKLSDTDYETALMMKFGLGSKQQAVLTARAINTISSRKDQLCKRIFGEKRPPEHLESLIQSL